MAMTEKTESYYNSSHNEYQDFGTTEKKLQEFCHRKAFHSIIVPAAAIVTTVRTYLN